MNDLIIKVSKDNRCVLPSKTIIGNDMENLQYNMVFEFVDKFVDGIARLEYQIDEDKNYIWINKKDNTYYVPIKNILTKEGNVQFQLVITEEETTDGIPVYKSDIFTLYCKGSLNSVDEAPDSYELWIDQANQLIMTMDEKIQEVENLDIIAHKSGHILYITITDKEGVDHNYQIEDGKDGEDGVGIESITKTSTVGLVDTYTITYTDGTTTTFTVTNGKDGVVPTQDLEQALMVYNALPKVTDTDTNITLDNTAKTPLKVDLKGNTSQDGTPTPSDPIDVNVVTGDNNINICGKNLFDMTLLQAGIWYAPSKTLTSTTSTVFKSFTIDLKAGNYTLSCNTNINIVRAFTDYNNSSDVIFSGTTVNINQYVMNITQDTKLYITLRRNDNTDWLETDLLQLEKGSTATTYEPYQSQSYPINLGTTELCKIGDYQDYIYKSGDNWYIHKEIGKVVLDENITLNYNGNAGQFYIENQTIIPNYKASTTLLSNYLQYSSTTWVKNCFGITNNNVFWLYIENGTTSLADLRTWLSTHNTIVYYVLATATDTQITNTTLINQLEALEDANSYDTQTNITQTNADLPFIITATAIRSLVDIFNGGA